MAKFNLKKILVQDYEVDLVQATNFEQWVGKNMDYEAVMEKDFKNISFKSSKTNKKDFLKDLKERALKLEPIKSITDILELFDEGSNKNAELYEKIRKLELELKDVKTENDLQYKRLQDAQKSKEKVYVLSEIQEKIISEYNSYLRKFDLGLDISEYEKAIGKITYKRHTTLKEILVENGICSDKVDEILLEWKEKQHNNFTEELNSNISFNNYEAKREELREQFKFINENQEFIETLIKLKSIEIKLPDNNKTERYSAILRTSDLVSLGPVFISGTLLNGKEHKTSWNSAAVKMFGTTTREVVLKEIGAEFESIKLIQNQPSVITIFEPIEKVIEKFNKKALEILKPKQKKSYRGVK